MKTVIGIIGALILLYLYYTLCIVIPAVPVLIAMGLLVVLISTTLFGVVIGIPLWLLVVAIIVNLIFGIIGVNYE